MEIKRLTALYDLFDHQIVGQIPEAAIGSLVEWGLIPKEGDYKCPNGHVLKLCPYDNTDGWMWR